MGIYEDFDAGAKLLIETFTPNGPNSEWVVTTQQTGTESWHSEIPTTVTRDVRIIFTRDKLEDRQRQRYIRDSTIRDGQVNGYMYHYPAFVPDINDTVRIKSSGQMLVIQAIDPIQPDPNFPPVLYEIEFGVGDA